MKGKFIIYFILLLFVTAIGLWGIPELVKTATYSRNQYPFVYFSSVKKQFLLRNNVEKKSLFATDEGVTLSEDEYDKALPLLNFRQLTVNGEMPDSIDGIAIDPRELRTKMVNFRYQPSETHTPELNLYILFESLPKKGNLESPGDVFRLNDKIQFIDDESNSINEEKSEKFQNALLKAGYTFPAVRTYGNVNIRKSYDEGYFSLDANGQFFHIKMVNGRPFVKNTLLADSIKPLYFSMLEVSDKRFYGFLFDEKGYVYILEEGGGKYLPVRLEIDPLDLNNDELSVMGNLMYWTVSVQNETGKYFYALENLSLKQVRNYSLTAPPSKWESATQWLFPFYLTFNEKNDNFIMPRLHLTALTAFIINFLLAFVFLFVKKTGKQKVFNVTFTLVFGIAGAIALFIIRN
jgi:hypothetical protein